MTRARISMEEKLASALCQMLRFDEAQGKLVPIIPYEHRKKMTANQVISLFEWHHNILHSHDGPDEHWNIEPLTIAEHRRETNNVTKPVAAKIKRIRGETGNGPKSKIAARVNPWPQGRKIQSRGFSTPRAAD